MRATQPQAILSRYLRENSKSTGGSAQQTMELLMPYEWPNNVPGLQNEAQRLVIRVGCDGIITSALLSPRLRNMEGVHQS